jgi:hypothetical protein
MSLLKYVLPSAPPTAPRGTLCPDQCLNDAESALSLARSRASGLRPPAAPAGRKGESGDSDLLLFDRQRKRLSRRRRRPVWTSTRCAYRPPLTPAPPARSRSLRDIDTRSRRRPFRSSASSHFGLLLEASTGRAVVRRTSPRGPLWRPQVVAFRRSRHRCSARPRWKCEVVAAGSGDDVVSFKVAVDDPSDVGEHEALPGLVDHVAVSADGHQPLVGGAGNALGGLHELAADDDRGASGGLGPGVGGREDAHEEPGDLAGIVGPDGDPSGARAGDGRLEIAAVRGESVWSSKGPKCSGPAACAGPASAAKTASAATQARRRRRVPAFREWTGQPQNWFTSAPIASRSHTVALHTGGGVSTTDPAKLVSDKPEEYMQRLATRSLTSAIAVANSDGAGAFADRRGAGAARHP